MKTSSKLVAAALAAMTLAASAGSALADRNQYTGNRSGMRMSGYGYHHHHRMYRHHRHMMRHHHRMMRHHRMM